MKNKFIVLLGFLSIAATSCDFLERPSLTTAEDETFWVSNENVEIYVNDIYPEYFIGYGSGYATNGAANTFSFSDDVVHKSSQPNFGRVVPNETSWSFSHVRKANILLEKINMMLEKGILTEPQFKQWNAIGHFLRGWEYADLTRAYGDVPYYDHVLKDTDRDELFKDREPRNEVFDKVIEDFKIAQQDMNGNLSNRTLLNKNSMNTVISRLVMYEASYQKYYYKNNERAKTLFAFAAEAADAVIESGMYNFKGADFKQLFSSEGSIPGKEVILERRYNGDINVTHCIGSSCNLIDGRMWGANLDFVKSFICNDGKTWQESANENADKFDMKNLIATRDSRFEATFYNQATLQGKASGLYTTKFISRKGLEYKNIPGGDAENKWKQASNVNSYPVIRYAETVLNWIECKAELETLGGSPVTQDDLDISINAIRKRKIAPEAEALGVKPTADLKLASLPNDPERDRDVPALLWEIRRERRMEFFSEYISRINDLKRWHKLEYMETQSNPDLLRGLWINFAEEMPKIFDDAVALKEVRVQLENGKFVEYTGNNKEELAGYFYPKKNLDRLPYLDLTNVNLYLSPMGLNTMNFYKERGYTLTQTEGWPTEQ